MAENEQNNGGSLEASESLEQDDTKTSPESSQQPEKITRPPRKGSLSKRLITRLSVVNIYFVIFMILLIAVIIITILSLNSAKNADKTDNVVGQTLTSEELAKLKEKDTKVGDAKQTLTIESNSIFNGTVLVKDNLNVAGGITVGSSLSLPGLSVSGTSKFDAIEIGSSASVGGSATVQGQFNIQSNLTVGQGATFGGNISAPSITINTLQLNGDLTISRHIDAAGPTPGITSGTGVGSGGTVSVSGNDTAGTVNINTGSGPVAGVLANITFSNAFKGTPHVVITPVGSAGAGLNFYVSRTTNGFSIATTNAAPANNTVIFDYIVMD